MQNAVINKEAYEEDACCRNTELGLSGTWVEVSPRKKEHDARTAPCLNPIFRVLVALPYK